MFSDGNFLYRCFLMRGSFVQLNTHFNEKVYFLIEELLTSYERYVSFLSHENWKHQRFINAHYCCYLQKHWDRCFCKYICGIRGGGVSARYYCERGGLIDIIGWLWVTSVQNLYCTVLYINVYGKCRIEGGGRGIIVVLLRVYRIQWALNLTTT